MFRGLRKKLGICTLKDYLSKDENGITYLENLLKEGKKLSYKNEYKLRKSIEAGYIYAKNKKTLFGFQYNEKQLFSCINGKLFIEYLISTDTNTYRMIETIKNHIEIIDIILNNDIYLIEYLNKNIIKKLISKDKDGNYLIEKYINNENAIGRLIKVVNDKDILIEICKKNNRMDLLKYCNEFVLMSKYKDYTIFEYLIKNNETPSIINNIIKNKKYIRFLLDNEYYDYLCLSNEDSLLIKIKGNKTLLDILLEKDLIEDISFSIRNRKTIDILNHYNKLSLAKTIDVDLLKYKYKKYHKLCLYEYLLNKGYKPKFYESLFTDEEDVLSIINLLYKRKEFDIIGKSIEKKYYSYELEEGISLIDKLLEENVDIDFGYRGIKNRDIVKKLFNKNRIDLLVNVDLNMLLNMVNEKETYLDYVLDGVKNKTIKFNLNNIIFTNDSVDELANFYLKLAKHNMIDYVDKLDVEDLLKEYNGERLLDKLLELDKELTINKILSKDVKLDLKIGIILKEKGINIDEINIPIIDKRYDKEYIDKKNNSYGIGPLQYNGDYLLNKLKELFLNDGESDKEIIDSLVLSYRHALIINYDYFIKELENLIKIKEKNKQFKFIKHNDSSYFNRGTGSVYSDNTVVNVINHETGHALHYYLDNGKMPKNFIEVVSRVRNNKELLNKAEKLSNDYNRVCDKIEQYVERKYNKYFNNYYTEEKINEIKLFLEQAKLEKKNELKDLKISDEILDNILNETFTCDEYINTQKRKFIEVQVDSIIRTEYSNIMAISDILDGIFEGELHSEVLLNKDNKLIKSSAGHGISYYSCNYEQVFRELIANFSTISKSINANEMLILLKDTIGEELYNLLSDYYYNNIIGIEKSKKIKTL